MSFLSIICQFLTVWLCSCCVVFGTYFCVAGPRWLFERLRLGSSVEDHVVQKSTTFLEKCIPLCIVPVHLLFLLQSSPRNRARQSRRGWQGSHCPPDERGGRPLIFFISHFVFCLLLNVGCRVSLGRPLVLESRLSGNLEQALPLDAHRRGNDKVVIVSIRLSTVRRRLPCANQSTPLNCTSRD